MCLCAFLPGRRAIGSKWALLAVGFLSDTTEGTGRQTSTFNTPLSAASPPLPLKLPHPANLLRLFPPLTFPSTPPPSLRFIVCVLTGRCHSGADLWAVRIRPCQERLSPLGIQMQTYTHTESGAHTQAIHTYLLELATIHIHQHLTQILCSVHVALNS